MVMGRQLLQPRVIDVNEIVVAMDDRRQGFPIRELLDCRFAGIDVIDILQFLERETGKVKVDLVTPAWMIFSEGFTANAMRDFVSRAFDLLVVIATGVIASLVPAWRAGHVDPVKALSTE